MQTTIPPWAEPVVEEAMVERAAVHRVSQDLNLLQQPYPGPRVMQASVTQQRAEAAQRLMRVTGAMCNQQRMLFNDLPLPFHWA